MSKLPKRRPRITFSDQITHEIALLPCPFCNALPSWSVDYRKAACLTHSCPRFLKWMPWQEWQFGPSWKELFKRKGKDKSDGPGL